MANLHTGSAASAATLRALALFTILSAQFLLAMVAILHGVPDHHAGAASGLLQMTIQVGGALGIAMLTAIYASAASSEGYASGLPAAFAGGATIAVVAALLAWTVLRAARAKKPE